MEHNKKIRRICKHCSKEFELRKEQLRQVQSKWPTHCSRSCAKKTQHARNHGEKRSIKNCLICKEPFQVAKWDSGKIYCSNKCAATGRFGEKNLNKTRERLNLILNDAKYLKYIQGMAKRISYKWNRGDDFAEELTQEFFLLLWEGNNTTIENTAKSLLRSELKRGITGKHDVDFSFSPMDAIGLIRSARNDLTSIEFKEYIMDLFSVLSEFERKFIWLYIKGFTDEEVKEEIRKKYPIGNQRFYDTKRELFKEIDYRNYGSNYKKRKIY